MCLFLSPSSPSTDADSEGGSTYFFHKVYVSDDVVNRYEQDDADELLAQPSYSLFNAEEEYAMDAKLLSWLRKAQLEYHFEGWAYPITYSVTYPNTFSPTLLLTSLTHPKSYPTTYSVTYPNASY